MPSLEAVARGLVEAYHNRTLVEAPSRTIRDLTKNDALEIAETARRLRIASGEKPVGYKVGFTNAAVREQFGAEARLAAPVYRETLSSARRIEAGALLAARIGPEVVIGIGPAGAPAWAAFGFEIVQSHVAGWDFGYLDAIADFGLHAALVIGDPLQLPLPELERFAQLRVRLLRDGDVVERGAGSDVDGGPLGSVEWLRSDLRRSTRDLVPGDIVSTGSLTRVPSIAPGERWTVEAEGGELPALTVTIV